MWQLRSLHQSSKQHISQVFFHHEHFLVYEQTAYSTPNMYCWSCETLITTYWTHLRVNGIWAKCFCHRKQISKCCSLRVALNGNVAIFIIYKWRHSNVTVIKLTAVTQITLHTKPIFWTFQIFKINRIMPFCN